MPSSMTRQPSFTTGKKMNSMMSCRAEDRRNHASRDLAAERDGHSASLKVNRRPGTFTSSQICGQDSSWTGVDRFG